MSVCGNINGMAIMDGGRLVNVDDLEKSIREVALALNDLLDKRPNLAGLCCGYTTLGNLRAEINALNRLTMENER